MDDCCRGFLLQEQQFGPCALSIIERELPCLLRYKYSHHQPLLHYSLPHFLTRLALLMAQQHWILTVLCPNNRPCVYGSSAPQCPTCQGAYMVAVNTSRVTNFAMVVMYSLKQYRLIQSFLQVPVVVDSLQYNFRLHSFQDNPELWRIEVTCSCSFKESVDTARSIFTL